jgi:hypothetical protein
VPIILLEVLFSCFSSHACLYCKSHSTASPQSLQRSANMDQNQNQNGATKLESGCRKLAAESYKCLETNPHAKCKRKALGNLHSLLLLLHMTPCLLNHSTCSLLRHLQGVLQEGARQDDRGEEEGPLIRTPCNSEEYGRWVLRAPRSHVLSMT